ncbi:TlpA family protein disulfide reductase [Winogradskyella aurantiaca]|uniref:TlpA family protein disulfide reductase n=1 Tax=Winogradskyella aurantiaca TaxID=2219558 RepID=UPI000E1C4C88|nr:TlpA disulfide reductase family protein [Winogradskyella aurantiaca]
MKNLLLVLLLVTAFSCAENEENKEVTYALFSGTITNTEATVAVISGPDFKKQMSIDPETRTFSDTLFLPKSGFYQFACGEYSTIYLENGYKLDISINAKQFDESITYTGIGSEENNYLADKFMDNEKMQGSIPEFYSLNEEDFKAKVEAIKTNHKSKLDATVLSNAVFATNETQNLTYEALVSYDNYESYHKSVTKNPEFKVSEDFLPKKLETIEFNDASLYSTSSGYRDLAMKKSLDDLFSNMEDFQSVSPSELAAIGDVSIPELKNEIIASYGTLFVSPGNPNMEANYKFLESETTSETTQQSLNIAYERGLTLRPGQPSPEFVNYENHKGGETSLADLRGKYVYVDVWATWCGPCIGEIPSLKEVEAKYHNSNIAFVSTSIDQARDHDKWVAMVNDKQLGGMQLMADNDWQSQFVKDYGIEGIPRFILIDPDGNIVSADAPRPSNPKLVEMLDELNM